MMLTILGPPNSGKSALAERLCVTVSRREQVRPVYLATLADTEARQARLARHRARRGPRWHRRDLNMTPSELDRALGQQSRRRSCVLLDGLGPLVEAQVARFQLTPSEMRVLADRLLLRICLGARHGHWIVVDTPVERDLNTDLGACLSDLHGRLGREGPLLLLERVSP